MQHDTLSLSQTRHSYANGYAPQTSLITSVLPGIIRKRISPLRSLREIASTYIRPSLHQRRSSDSSDASAPPPYSEEPVSDDEMDVDFTSAPSSRPSSSGSTTPILRSSTDLLRPDSLQSAENLIRNKFANHGLLLVAQSAHESRASIHANDEYQRRLYLDGIAYLLRGLPNGLSEEEAARLRAALPETIRESNALEWPRPDHAGEPTQSVQQPFLRIVVQTVVFWLFFLFAAALPHIRNVVGRIYAFEKKHRLGEQVLAQGLVLAQVGYTQLLALLCAIWAVNDGAVGRFLTSLGMWCAQNISDGIRDGLSEAAAALRRSDERQ